MKTLFKILCTFLCFASLSACDNKKDTSSSCTSSTPVSPNEEAIATLKAFKTTLSSLKLKQVQKLFLKPK